MCLILFDFEFEKIPFYISYWHHHVGRNHDIINLRKILAPHSDKLELISIILSNVYSIKCCSQCLVKAENYKLQA